MNKTGFDIEAKFIEFKFLLIIIYDTFFCLNIDLCIIFKCRHLVYISSSCT